MRNRKLPLLASALLFAVTACSDRLETPTESAADAELDLQAALQSSQGSEKVRVILTFKSMGGAHSMAASMAGAQAAGNGRVLRTYEHFPMVAIEVSENALPALRRAPGLVAITPDVAEPPALDQSLAVINADDVRALGWTGDGITVAILDTGIDQDHPFFAGRIVSQACYSNHDPGNNETSLCPGNAASSTAADAADTDIAACNNNGNLCDHGTHVAGIAAGDGTGVMVANAQQAGVAPGADIIAIQVFTRFDDAADCSPSAAPCVLSYTSDQIAGLDRVYALRNTYTIAAANMSLGGGQNNTACDGTEAARKTAIDQLITANIATVIAAGNNGFNASVGAPGCISTAVTVGATDNTDAIAGFSNRGVLLDLFAPGVNNWSSGSNGGFEQKSGTSMATPHVTGAWAVMRQVLGNASVADILNRLQTTGVDIDYVSGGANVTTPRINLLAAIQTAADPPSLTVANDPVTVDEGQTATNSGTYASDDGDVTLAASVGAAAGGGASNGNWSWSFDTNDGPAESQTVTITGTDQLDQDGEVSFELVVNNVAPAVTIAPGQVVLIDEGDNLSVNASFTDPGTLDTHTAVVTCHTVGGPQTVAGTVNQAARTVSATCPYGDDSNPTFAVTVAVTDNDGGEGSASFDLTVENVDPTAAIDKSSAVLINGVPAFIAQIGVPLSFDGNATDPGSDDIEMKWDWADGAFTTNMFLVNPPAADPLPSPDIDPRDVDDTQSHSWTTACMFDISLLATDDDGGSDSDAATVIIAGNSGRSRSMGYWQTAFRGKTSFFDSATLDCYRSIVGFMSAVFDEEVDASTQAKAAQVLFPKGNASISEMLDAQLLAAWLNFANGAYGWNALVDTDGDKVADTAFSTAILAAEAVRLNPASTRAELEAQKNILEWINTMHE